MRAWLLLIAFIMMACGGGQRAALPGGSVGDTFPVPTTPRDPDPTTPGTGTPGSPAFNWPNGSTVDMTVSDVGVLEQYTGRPMNFPSGPVTVKLNIDLRDVSSETFGGAIRIGYAEPFGNTVALREALFDAGQSQTESMYNQFKTFDGKIVFRAFAEDSYGAVLVVMDQFTSLTNVSGAIYFHNFTPTYAPKPPPPSGRCWFIQIGPYECRDFLVGSGDDDDKTMSIGSSIYPNRIKDGSPYFVKLGTFTALDGNKAFGK